jgi:hypothetical protein
MLIEIEIMNGPGTQKRRLVLVLPSVNFVIVVIGSFLRRSSTVNLVNVIDCQKGRTTCFKCFRQTHFVIVLIESFL